MRATIHGWTTASCLALALVACGTAGESREDEGVMVVTAAVAGTQISTVTIDVTAADISPGLTFNLTVENGYASGTIRVPPGDDRTIVVRAYDTLDQITHEGSLTIDVIAGQNPALRVPVVPRSGQLDITIQIGPVSVYAYATTGGTSVALDPGGTATVHAAAQDAAGVRVPDTFDCFDWATTDPRVATVADSPWGVRYAVVTAVAPGTAKVVATCAGVAAVVDVVVNDWLSAGYSAPFEPQSGLCSTGEVLAEPIEIDQAMTVTRLGLHAAGYGGDSYRLALYTDSGGSPGTLLTGTDFAPAFLGANELPVPHVAVAAGTYWLAYQAKWNVEFGACVYVDVNATETLASGTLEEAAPWPASYPLRGTWSYHPLNLFVKGQP